MAWHQPEQRALAESLALGHSYPLTRWSLVGDTNARLLTNKCRRKTTLHDSPERRTTECTKDCPKERAKVQNAEPTNKGKPWPKFTHQHRTADTATVRENAGSIRSQRAFLSNIALAR